MKKLNRREFVSNALTGAGAVWAGLRQTPLLRAATPLAKKEAMDPVLLGNTGIRLSRLAMGSGTNGTNYSSDQVRLGLKTFSSLLIQGYDQGINFWEAADQYGSHLHLSTGLKQVGRDRLVLLTKTHARTAAQMRADLDRFRKELGTDYIDIVLLHCMVSPQWPEERKGAMGVLEEARQKGVVRAHGVSCHTLEALQVAAKHPWVQVDLARINPIQAHMDADPVTVISVLREMKKAGKGIIGMKILGAGKLTHDVNRAIEHAVKLDCLDSFTIGFTSLGQLEEVITKMPRLSVS
jgi:aryl-alcohol dehydrogenase-like predicted oxidoreductase